MPKPLVIVESPAKAKTIASFLGAGYIVESSIGHIRDLPRSAADVPAAYKGEAWARLGVDVDNDFKPLYVVAQERQDQVKRLKRLLRDASELYLATDEDREGESIAWHLLEVLSPTVPVKRMVFHEITRHAIQDAIEHPRELDRRLVDAQEARRILDRLYGYELSPVLWKKVMQGLSAGRVQSVATRIVVDRERERMRFVSASWWSLTGQFTSETGEVIEAGLARLGEKDIADGSDFNSLGAFERQDSHVALDEGAASSLSQALKDATFSVKGVEERPYKRSPAAPFITSTLQQEAARKLHFSAQRAMQVAQRLYEQGYITYMRTDSTTLSDTALKAARAQALALFGPGHVPQVVRTYDRKVRNAQEAHEAIRPAGDTFRTPSEVASELRRDELRLYELVWQRTVASQMNDAVGVTQRVRIVGQTTMDSLIAPFPTTAEFSASGTVITAPGFMRVYEEGVDDDTEPTETEDARIPALGAGDALSLYGIDGEGHATKPPARFTEATLVRRLEELGVGRPSTYANILQTIQDRGYVWKKGTALVPSFTAFAVVGLLEEHFPNLVDYGFTASMEDDLDEIATGGEEAVPWLERFYFGAVNGTRARESENLVDKSASSDAAAPGAQRGLKQDVAEQLVLIDAREVNSIPLGKGIDGEQVVVRVGRYGPYLQRGEDRAPIPLDLAPDELTLERAEELLAAPSGDRELGVDPTSGLMVYVRAGRFGPYVQLGEASPDSGKPQTASLFKSMSPEALELSDALELLRLPRLIGIDALTGEEIVARNGRYGPYIQRGSDSRSVEEEQKLLEITLEEALGLFAQPKQRRFGREAATPGREMGVDPDTNEKILLKRGRFGPYVTDGKINASLRRGDDAESLSFERAVELLADKRAAGPATPRARRSAKKAAPKKSTAKKAPAKKAVPKKTTAKKAAAKKTTPRTPVAQKADKGAESPSEHTPS
jgi:DNA topoisomerase-1